MLQSLHVKNLALMEETEVEFGRGLNILTGETGAGKSLLIGSVNLALGGKFEKEMLRKGADSALVELVFTGDTGTDSGKIAEKLQKMDLDIQEDGSVIISRKMQVGKSICKINGETVTAKQVRELAEVLIDIHGQHEHQSLLRKQKHMEILDVYCGAKLETALKQVEEAYRKRKQIVKTMESETMDEEQKSKEQALAQFEYDEIQEAKLLPGEDEELEKQYKKMTNSRKIIENLAESYQYTGNDSEGGAGSALSRALRNLRSITMYDPSLEQLEQQLSEVDNLLSDYNRDISEYMSDCEFDQEDFERVEERLNTINHLKGKYGSSIPEILTYGGEKQAFLEKISNYDAYMAELERQLQETEEILRQACEKVSKIRKDNAKVLSGQLQEALEQLNFLTVHFQIDVRPEQNITEKGFDEVEFMISTNPGENVKPLGQVASGGELSRVMLAIKTVLAGRDDIDTLIFDEIDAGISGKTAWKVSEQLNTVAREHQVICITHLPQIAAMADVHFVIEKSSTGEHTITDIRCLEEEESTAELARLLGSDELSPEALSNAAQMKQQAREHKRQIQI